MYDPLVTFKEWDILQSWEIKKKLKIMIRNSLKIYS